MGTACSSLCEPHMDRKGVRLHYVEEDEPVTPSGRRAAAPANLHQVRLQPHQPVRGVGVDFIGLTDTARKEGLYPRNPLASSAAPVSAVGLRATTA